MEIGNRTTEAAALLKLGNDLTEFAINLGSGTGRVCPAKQTLAMIFERLAAIGDVDLLTDAMALYNDLDSQADRDADTRRRRDQADAAERRRRHETALTSQCPHCKSAPGEECRSVNTTNPQPLKGWQYHKPRYRKATANSGTTQ